ncbi:MAG: DUF1330 domain-containing protein [Myxococcota bacterium]
MKTLRLAVLALVLASPVIFAFAARARADVWMLDIHALQAGAPAHLVGTYSGAFALVARLHGGERVSRFRGTELAGAPHPSFVSLWRFRDARALEAFLADPAYASLAKLRARAFDDGKSTTLELVAEGSPASL